MTIIEAVKAAKQGYKVRPAEWQKEWSEKGYAGQSPCYVFYSGLLWRGSGNGGISNGYTPSAEEILGEWEVFEAKK